MDVNRTRFHLLAGPAELRVTPSLEDGDAGGLAWHAQECLALPPDQRPNTPRRGTSAEPGAAWVRDRFGQHARIAEKADAKPGKVVAGRTILHDAGRGWAPVTRIEAGKDVPLAPPKGTNFVDLAIGGPPGDERLAALWKSSKARGVLLFHLRTRWTAVVDLGDAELPDRILVDDRARVWTAGDDGVRRIEGAPLPQPYVPKPARFEPRDVVPEPPRVAWPPDKPLAIPGVGDGVRGLATDGASLYLVAGPKTEPVVLVRPLESAPEEPWTPHVLPADTLPAPLTDVAALAPGRLALLADFDDFDDPAATRPRPRDCPVVALRAGEAPEPVPERHPFVEKPWPRFVASADGVVRWRGARRGVQVLEALEIARFSGQGGGRLATIDSALPGCVWHKVVLEARIPPTTSVVVEARAADSPDAFASAGNEPDVPWQRQPAPSWMPLLSEIPWESAASVSSRRGESGCFELLLQRTSGRVRRLTGRYLQIRLRFSGDGRTTPALRRVRVHFPRFSYQEHYLPLHFRQQERVGGEGDRANGADFRERLLAVFEGLLTPIEDRVAAAEQLADPRSCPAPLLPRLAGILGEALDDSIPLDVRRRVVAGAGEVARHRGTLRGVRAALDLVTGDAARRGRIVIVENHRLRRTMATLLGVRIDDAQNPLTLGMMRSGNSIVGDSLILSAESARAFLAAIDPSLASADDRALAKAFFDRWAHQVTVVLHGDAKPFRATVERVLRREMPAHVQWKLVVGDATFVIGLSPLLDVDTAVEEEPGPRPVVLDRTLLSQGDVLADAAAISPFHVHSGQRT